MIGFTAQKDVSFMDDAGKNVPGRLLNGTDSQRYKVFGKSAEGIELGVEYDFSVKSTDQKGVHLIDGKTLKKADGTAATPAMPHSAYQAPETDKRQASIEAQNARTNLTALCIAGKLTEAEETKLIMQLCSFAGIHYDTEEPLVEAVKAQGGVETISGMKPARKA